MVKNLQTFRKPSIKQPNFLPKYCWGHQANFWKSFSLVTELLSPLGKHLQVMRVCLVKFSPPFFCFHDLQLCVKLKISYLVPFQDTEDEDWVYELKAQFQEVEMVDLVID